MAKANRIVGIDLAQWGNYVGVAVLDGAGRAVEPPLRGRLSDDDLLARVRSAMIVGIDAPLCFPAGMDCFQPDHCADGRRRAELDLYRLGISCYWTTKNAAPTFRPVIERGMELSRRMTASGLRVVEVYPYGAACRLFGRPPHRKATQEGRAWFTRVLRTVVASLPPGDLHPDCADAALAAYTALLVLRSEAEPLGRNADGLIWIPPGLPLPSARSRLDA
ncbi:MAG: DUF429 domain-containing protein [Dehalococcoidia bacterium]|nr:DUF429 domain-containing protein [Dehalococcoidia bacterium]